MMDEPTLADVEFDNRAYVAKHRAIRLFAADTSLRSVSIYFGVTVGMEMGVTLTWFRDDLMKEAT